MNRGDLNRALTSVDTILENPSSLDTYWYWKLTGLKAEILLRQRHIEESMALLKPDLPVALRGTDVALWRELTLGMGNAYNLNFSDSERLLSEAESLAKTNHPDLLGEVLLRQGTLAWSRHDFQLASSRYQAALQEARERKNPVLEAASLGNLGLTTASQQHYDESLDWNRQALAKALAIQAPGYATVISFNIGWSYRELGDYESALDLFEQMRSSAQRSQNLRVQIEVLLNSGVIYHQQHNYELAKSAFQSALAISDSIADKDALAECFEGLARLDLATGDITSAQENEQRLAAFVREYPERSRELGALLVRGSLEQARKQYRSSEPLFQQVALDPAATAPQRWEAQAGLAETYGFENRFSDAERQYREALKTIERARSSLSAEELRLSFLSSPIRVYDSYIEFLLKHSRSREALQVAELSRAQTLEDGLGPGIPRGSSVSQSIAPESVARRLDATLLFYWLGEKHSYLWVITALETAHFALPKSDEVAPRVKAYRQAILDGRDVLSQGNGDGERLYTMLVAPARRLIAKNSRVILLPAESLYGLNFEALVVPDPTPHFWIDDVTLSTASSLALLSAGSQKPLSSQRNLLLLGNPEPANPDIASLPQAAAEIQKVSTHFLQSQRRVLEGKQATASAYLHSNPEQFSHLHFVTHGTASQTRPLESAVILTAEGDSYKLYARDIVTHPLRADLVTISACNGAGTRAYAGEGLVGLSWAFLRAGAHNVIASLWEVSDASTPQLMDELYKGLSAGQDPASALRTAKLTLLHSDTVFRKPFYWAPFQLYAGS